MEGINLNSALAGVKIKSNPTSLTGAVSLKMLDKTMEMADTMNQSMVKMMENSVTPHLGGNIDLSV